MPNAPTVPSTLAQHQSTSGYLEPVRDHLDHREVLHAVRSLYRDQLRPYGRIIRKRLEEQAAGSRTPPADVDPHRLHAVCRSLAALRVQAEEGGDWSATLRDQPDDFVNVYSPEDCYPPELWEAADRYFGSLTGSNMKLPGGRYSCAQVLVERQLPFLSGYSLGQVCHIVQLSISQKKLLGYLNGSVVPHGHSKSMLKERAAQHQAPCSTSSRSSAGVATWPMVRDFLQGAFGKKVRSIPLSSIKRLFKAKFQVDLSETSLGHCKLSGLLQDPRVSDLCVVRLQKHGYVVFPGRPRPLREVDTMPGSFAETAEGRQPCAELPTLLGRGQSAASRAGEDVDGRAEKAVASSTDVENSDIWARPLLSPDTLALMQAGIQRNTFIHLPESDPTPCCRPRALTTY